MIVHASHGCTVVRNDALEDARLSFRARGLLSYLLARPAGYALTTRGLARAGREGRTAVASAVRELVVAGYLSRVASDDGGADWQVTDDPTTDGGANVQAG